MIILVADDDRLIRFMMKSMLNEILTTDYTILEATNGKEMVEVCKKRMPDVVFADIKMPYMNGIDAIIECKKHSEDSEFVVISGYSEFEYAQRALKLGVYDYLLKPVSEEQLRSVVKKLHSKIIGHKKESNSRFQLKLFNAFNYFATVGEREEYKEENYGTGLMYEVIGMKSKCQKQNQEIHIRFQKEIINRMDILGKELIKDGSYYSHIYSSEGTTYFVFYTSKERKKEILSYVKKLTWKNKSDKIAFNFIHFSKESIKEVYYECEKVDNSCGVEMNYKIGEVIDISSINISEEGKEILKSMYHIIDSWERADSVAYKDELNKIYQKYKDVDTDINLEYISKYCSTIMQQKIKCETYKVFCQSFAKISESMYENIGNTEGDVIAQVKSYVESYYMNDIGIGQIAELFDITPNYLSTIFHQKAGCKFVDYLTKIRISNAKRLLIQNKTASVKDIAVMVGYNSSRYFATLFQKMTGMKPSAYRKENIVS